MKHNYGFPTRDELETAIVKALEQYKGEATVREINDAVVQILELPEEIVELEDESGLGTKLDYRLRWCRTNLKNEGKIVNVQRGTWKLMKGRK